MNLDDFLENPDQNPPILGFRGEYRFMSNFYPVSVNFNHQWFPTVEHAYQAAKVRDALRMIQEHSRYFTDSELRQLAEDALLTYKGHFIHDPDEY